MAFGNISTFYLPTDGNAGSNLYGPGDVRKLLDSADAGTSNTTILNHGTGGNVTRTIDPFSTSSADLTEADYGFAVTDSDMNSVSGARRFFPAGNHVFTGRMRDLSGVGTTNSVLTMYLFRVGASPGYTRTLLGSNTSTFNLPSGGVYATVNVTVNLAELVLDPGESIQYEWEFFTSGIAITGKTVTFATGTQGGVAIRIDHPGLGTRYFKEFSTATTFLASLGPHVIAKAFATSVAFVASLSTFKNMFREFSTSTVFVSTMTSLLTARRAFTTSAVFTASLLVRMSQTVLNRISGGSTTRKKVIVYDKV